MCGGAEWGCYGLLLVPVLENLIGVLSTPRPSLATALPLWNKPVGDVARYAASVATSDNGLLLSIDSLSCRQTLCAQTHCLRMRVALLAYSLQLVSQ